MKTHMAVRVSLVVALLAAVVCPQAARAGWGVPSLPKISGPKIPSVNDVKDKLRDADRARLEKQRDLERRARELDRQRLEAQRQLEGRLAEARAKVREVTTHSSNKASVQAGLRQGGWQVALGKEIDYREYYLFSQAVAASVASQNPAPVMGYIQYMAAETKREVLRNLDAEARRTLGNLEMQLVAAIDRAIKTGRVTELRFGGLDVRIGIATYNHWKVVSGHYPKIDRGSITWTYMEKRFPLPNTHQPYVAYRLRYSVR